MICVIDRVEENPRTDNQPTMGNGYPIFEWAPGFPILNDDEDENKISNFMEQVAYDFHVEPYDEDEENTGEDDVSDGHDDRDDNKDPE